MVVSYPNNPTAAVAPEAFLREAVDFCREHKILLVHDFPYAEMVYGDYRAPSVLTQSGALDTAVELYSASKSFHMGGFRIGWAVGNADALAALAKVKGAVDFNQYRGIQAAAVAALEYAEADVRQAAKDVSNAPRRAGCGARRRRLAHAAPTGEYVRLDAFAARLHRFFCFCAHALTETTGVYVSHRGERLANSR